MENYNEEIFSRKIKAGKRTYFFDVKATRSNGDLYITITERKRIGENGSEKHKIFLYKEDFDKFTSALNETVAYVKNNFIDGFFEKKTQDIQN